jgi:hypothetical protein
MQQIRGAADGARLDDRLEGLDLPKIEWSPRP